MRGVFTRSYECPICCSEWESQGEDQYLSEKCDACDTYVSPEEAKRPRPSDDDSFITEENELRDLFAMTFLRACINSKNPPCNGIDMSKIAESAYNMAEFMLKARKKFQG